MFLKSKSIKLPEIFDPKLVPLGTKHRRTGNPVHLFIWTLDTWSESILGYVKGPEIRGKMFNVCNCRWKKIPLAFKEGPFSHGRQAFLEDALISAGVGLPSSGSGCDGT